MRNLLILFLCFIIISCQSQQKAEQQLTIEPGAWQVEEYLPSLKGKSVAMVVNQTSTIGKTHLVDSLISLKIDIKAILSPEHGFRGDEPDGAIIDNSIDEATGVPIISLYGDHKKPTADDLTNIDVVIYDIQDVGVRFYTYISTMHYVMQACAELGKSLIILDRPNPNGYYVAGPVLDTAFSSFVGMHPIPIVYGLTAGELAGMINGEGWIGTPKCDLTIVKNVNYTHSDRYILAINPSPNLPTDKAVELYPSLCLFEPTVISIGRGTRFPFQVIGYPDSTFGNFSFTPISIPNMSKYPKYENITCYGLDLRRTTADGFSLDYLLDYYNKTGKGDSFFTSPSYFDRLAGSDQLRLQILSGASAQSIEQSWQPSLEDYLLLRKKYLLYADFK